MASLDVDRGRVAVARVRTGEPTRRRRVEEGQVRGEKTLRDEHEQTKSNTNVTSEEKTFARSPAERVSKDTAHERTTHTQHVLSRLR